MAQSHINPFRTFFDLFQTEEVAFAGAGADVADTFPGGFVLEM